MIEVIIAMAAIIALLCLGIWFAVVQMFQARSRADQAESSLAQLGLAMRHYQQRLEAVIKAT